MDNKRLASEGEGKKEDQEPKLGPTATPDKEIKGRVKNAPSIDERIEHHLTSYMIEMSEGR